MMRWGWARRMAAGMLGWWLVSPALAQGAAALPAELFFKPAEFIDARLSPNGKRLALTSTMGTTRVGLYVIDLDTPGQSTAPARFRDIDVRSFTWLDDERLLYQLIDHSVGSGYQEGPGLFVVRFDGEQSRQLIMTQPTAGGANRPLPWGFSLLQVPRGAGDEVIVGGWVVAGGEGQQLVPHWLNTATGRARPIRLDAPVGAVGWIFDSRGEARVAIGRREGKRQVHWRGPGDAEWRLLAESSLVSAPFVPRFVDDKGGLYVTHSGGAGGTSVLARFDFATGKPEAEPFVSTPGFDFTGSLVTDADTGRLLGVRTDTDAEGTTWFDPALKRVQQLADEKLPGYVNRLTCRRCGEPDMVVLVQAWSARDPGHLWLYRAATGQWQLINRARAGVDPRAMARVEFERIRARDGRDLPLWLTVPPGRKAGDGGPAVVMVHGGPWLRGGHWQWDGMDQFLASRGYVVVSPEFRGSAGFGYAHREAGFKQWGRAMQDDVADAARWAQKQGWADRFCIAGASYGGYSTLMGLINDPDLFKCGVAWVAVADPMLYLEGSWLVDDDIGSTARRHTMPQMVGDPVQDAEMLKAVSPVLQAARIRNPLLLAYGRRDRRVPIEHGERLRSAMRAAGHEPEWVVYGDEAHGWLRTENRVDFARRVERFLGQHLAAPGR